MPSTTATAETAIRPETYRLPKPGESDPFFGFSRSYYYEGEQRGYWKLIRIVDKRGRQLKHRGVTLIPFEQVATFVRQQMEEQVQ